MGRSRFRFGEGHAPHFLTCTVVGWLPLFTRPETVQILLDSWQFLQDRDRMVLLGYVVLENHIHFIASAADLPREVGDFKSYTARRIIDHLKERRVRTLLDGLEYHKARYHQKTWVHHPGAVFVCVSRLTSGATGGLPASAPGGAEGTGGQAASGTRDTRTKIALMGSLTDRVFFAIITTVNHHSHAHPTRRPEARASGSPDKRAHRPPVARRDDVRGHRPQNEQPRTSSGRGRSIGLQCLASNRGGGI